MQKYLNIFRNSFYGIKDFCVISTPKFHIKPCYNVSKGEQSVGRLLVPADVEAPCCSSLHQRLLSGWASTGTEVPMLPELFKRLSFDFLGRRKCRAVCK